MRIEDRVVICPTPGPSPFRKSTEMGRGARIEDC